MEHTSQPRSIDLLLAQYAESHRNPTNELIHFACIPAIVFSLLGILWAMHPVVALAVVLGSLYYYLKLSRPFAIGMALMSAAMLALLALMPPLTVLPFSIAVFVVAWIGQFIGHKIEGKKPSFFDDLRFLLIGPLFVLSFLYRRLRVAY
ncbi:Mpo1 family 2-hydroxy fatty acid dioxygenase [Massilia niastensis]|uniref:Mpo1 family 2-hydroxy fatty acid dioxygenase n=1 Tax=Massilia niastensis TaxID=544911 RepID=UPI00037D1E40|nr:Mpo1-like protein [Massilia niastensis]